LRVGWLYGGGLLGKTARRGVWGGGGTERGRVLSVL